MPRTVYRHFSRHRRRRTPALLPTQKAARMKTLLLRAAALLVALDIYGQGSGIVNFGNASTTPDRRIWVFGPDIPREGVLAAGTSYHIALYWGQQGTPEFGLVQVGAPVSFLTSTAAGTFVGGNRTLAPLNANGGVVTLQARAWGVIPGVPDSYEGVLAGGLSGDPP